MGLRNINQLSELTGMSYRTVKSRLAQLAPVQEGRALLYESKEALPMLYEVMQSSGTYDLEEERARLAHHQANNEALKERTLNGELLPAELVIELGAALVGAARAKVLAIHSKVRSRFPGIDRDIADEVEALSHEALTELGSDGIPTDIRRRIAPAVRRMESTAEADD